MRLSQLLSGIPAASDYTDVEISDIQTDSRQVSLGSLYVCLKGSKTDGHRFAKMAVEKGAAAILCEQPLQEGNWIAVPDTHEAYGLLCRNFYHNPAQDMTLVAVTGTNGKTSVATIIHRLLLQAGVESGLISTIRAEYGTAVEALERTTPDAKDLYRLLQKMKGEGIRAVCMEASSHALDQKRLAGLHASVAVFTNLTRDHLDYHNNMEEYFRAKRKLFSMTDFAVVNIDDPYGKKLAEGLAVPFATCSIADATADYMASDISCGPEGVRFQLHHDGITSRVEFGIPGLYSVHNALAAIAACHRLGLSLDRILAGLRQIGVIRGRNERIGQVNGFSILCDYAHTPDGLENILKTTRAYVKGRILLVFGCGGDRDKEKRPMMGKVAAEYADKIILTSDNPRTERPNAILADILKGIPPGHEPVVIPDRKDAVRYAIVSARRGDVVLLAGKGHEEYQILADKKLYFDERRLVKGILHSLNLPLEEADGSGSV